MERINRLVEAIFIHLDCDNDPSQKELPCNQSEILIILLGVILGLSLRLSFLVNNDFPLNDGGMFYTMAKDLIANGFSLPVYTSYNQSQIPFAYPPLSIYFLAGIHQVTGIDLLRLLQYVPFAFNLASIPVVYGLVYRLTQSRRQAGLAALTYALIRPGYESFLYGGGLTRASSWLFALLTLERFVLSLKIPSFKNWMFVVLCLTLATACHLEIGWFTVFSMLVIYFFYARNLKSLIRLVVAGISFFLLLTPYWGSLLRNHGVGVFQNALQAGEFQPELSLFKLFVFNFTNEMLFQLFGVVAFVGLMACILSRKLFFPVWLVVITFLDPRSADRSASVVTSALVAAGMDQVIVPALMKISAWKSPPGSKDVPATRQLQLWIMVSLFVYFSMGAVMEKFIGSPRLVSLSEPNRRAMAAVSTLVAPSSSFLVLSKAEAWHTDMVSEWFPALTNHHSVLTVQGTEWLDNQVYDQQIKQYDDLKRCLKERPNCVRVWLNERQLDYQYIYLEKELVNKGRIAMGELLTNHEIIYENEGVIVMLRIIPPGAVSRR